MKQIWRAAAVSVLLISGLGAQDQSEKIKRHNPADSASTRELRADVDRLKVLVNQMRTNLAFVQTSQSPLKHQFELEADAWQLIVEQMDKRLKQMEEQEARDSRQ